MSWLTVGQGRQPCRALIIRQSTSLEHHLATAGVLMYCGRVLCTAA